MSTLYLKIVPNKEPNADGHWIKAADIPEGTDPYDLAPLPNYHVVQARCPESIQDGGPMHAGLLKQLAREPIYKFKPYWFEKDRS
jgi:hypothetical protein